MTKTKYLMKKSADLTDYQPLHRHRADVLNSRTVTFRRSFRPLPLSVQSLTAYGVFRKKTKLTDIYGMYLLSLPGKKEKLRRRKNDRLSMGKGQGCYSISIQNIP
jgi:hypothetical protein